MEIDNALKLIKSTYHTDSIGQKIKTETAATVFCKVSSVTASEFFEAGRAGLEAKYRVTVYAFEYSGEKIVELDGIRYGVYRTYQKNRDTIELYLEKKAGI